MKTQRSNLEQSSQKFIEFFTDYVESHAAAKPADFNALETEKDNIIQAVDLAYNSRKWGHVLRLVGVVGRQPNGFLDARGYWAEALHCYELAIKAAKKLDDKGEQGVFTLNNAMVLKKQGKFSRAQRKTQEAYLLLKGLRTRKEEFSDVVHELGMQALDKGEVQESEKIHLKNLKFRRDISYLRGIAYSTHELGRLARIQGDFERAKRFLEESLKLRESFKDDLGAPSPTLHDLGCAELGEGIRIYKLDSFSKARPHYRNAKRYLQRSLKLKKLLGMQSPIANTLHEMGRLASFSKQYDEAEEYLRTSLKVSEALHQQAEASHNLFALAENEYERGNLAEAERLCRKVTSIKEILKDTRGLIACNYLSGLIAEKQGDIKKAVRLLERAYKDWTEAKQWQAELALSKLNQLKESNKVA